MFYLDVHVIINQGMKYVITKNINKKKANLYMIKILFFGII